MALEDGARMTLPKESSSNIVSILPFQFNPTQHVWQESEEAYLQEHYKTLSVKELSQHLKRTPRAVSRRAYVLGLKKSTYKKWTKEEQKYLRVAYPTRDIKEIAQKLNRTISAIKGKAYALGITRIQTDPDSQKAIRQLELTPIKKKPERRRQRKSLQKPWEDTELTFLRQQFSQLSLEEMSQQLQRPESEILNKLRQIFPVSTRRPLFYKLLTAEIDKLMISGISTQFLQHLKDRALFIGQKWIQHPKAVCMRLIGFRLYIKGIITLAYNQVTGTEAIPYKTEWIEIYRRRYSLRQHLCGGNLQ